MNVLSIGVGFTFRRKKIVGSEKSEAQFKRRVKELTGCSWGVSMAHRLEKLSEYLRGCSKPFVGTQWVKVPSGKGWQPAADILISETLS